MRGFRFFCVLVATYLSMLRRSLIHVLLSLLLLVSQQMALAHGFAHRTDERQTAQRLLGEAGGKMAKTAAADHACAQCLAAAQVAFALNGPLHTFAAGDFSFAPALSPAVYAASLRPVRLFQPRAPPQA